MKNHSDHSSQSIHIWQLLRRFISRSVFSLYLVLASCGDDDTGFRTVKAPVGYQPNTTEDRRDRPVGFDLKNVQDIQDSAESSSPSPTSSVPPFPDETEPLAATPTPETPVASATPEAPVASATPEAPVASATPEAPVASATPEAPVASATPQSPLPTQQPETPFLEIQFGQGTSRATFISCAVMHLSFFKLLATEPTVTQEHFDLGCSRPNHNGDYEKTKIEIDKQTVCIELGLSVRTFRNRADWRKKGPYWERTLPAAQNSSDNRFFELTGLSTESTALPWVQPFQKFEIGYEDLPGPYESTDMDNNDLVIEFSRSAGIDLRIPPFQAACQTQN